MAFDHSKFLARFVEEAREHCSRISEGLLNLESSPGDSELVNGLFRSAHTIKGSSRMMKLMGVTELAHKMEDILDAVRGNRLSLSPPMADLLFKGVDALQAMLEQIVAGNKSPDAPEALCEALAKAAAGEMDETATQEALPEVNKTDKTDGTDTEPIAPISPIAPGIPEPPKALDLPKAQKAEYLRVNALKLDELIHLMGEIVSEHGRFRKDVSRLHEQERLLAQYQSAVLDCLKRCAPGDEGHDELKQAGEALQASLHDAVRVIKSATMMQDHLIGDLQETSMKLRMLPLSTVFDPLRRTVREISQEAGKQIEFVVDGGDTELDRKIIDRIGDSLVHLIRNSLDHGLENAAERIAAGKTAQGSLMLSACYDGGSCDHQSDR